MKKKIINKKNILVCVEFLYMLCMYKKKIYEMTWKSKKKGENILASM